ncbi:hypothetical protein N2152v2_004733 [Parachlorella kessleri]
MFYWSSKPETLDDLEDLLNEPPPAPGAPVGVSFPYLTGEVERLPVSINSSCPLDHDEKAEVQQQKQLCSSTLSPVEDKGSSWLQRLPGPELLAQPTSSAGAAGQHQATAATGSSDGWLSYVPGSSFIWSRPSSSETGSQIPSKTHVCSDSSVFGSQVGTTLAQPQPVAGGWLHYVPGSGLLVWMHSTDSSKAAATAASLIDAQSQEQRGQHSAIGNRGSTSGGQATATPTGWHLPNLHIPSLTWPSGSGTAKPAPQPEERELEVLHKKRSESAMPSMEGTPGEGGAGDKQQQQQQASALSSQLSAALHRSWHQAEAVVISPLGVSVLGAAVGGVVAGPLGVAVGAKAGAALVELQRIMPRIGILMQRHQHKAVQEHHMRTAQQHSRRS